jgi:hypothetical protein
MEFTPWFVKPTSLRSQQWGLFLLLKVVRRFSGLHPAVLARHEAIFFRLDVISCGDCFVLRKDEDLYRPKISLLVVC